MIQDHLIAWFTIRDRNLQKHLDKNNDMTVYWQHCIWFENLYLFSGLLSAEEVIVMHVYSLYNSV